MYQCNIYRCGLGLNLFNWVCVGPNGPGQIVNMHLFLLPCSRLNIAWEVNTKSCNVSRTLRFFQCRRFIMPVRTLTSMGFCVAAFTNRVGESNGRASLSATEDLLQLHSWIPHSALLQWKERHDHWCFAGHLHQSYKNKEHAQLHHLWTGEQLAAARQIFITWKFLIVCSRVQLRQLAWPLVVQINYYSVDSGFMSWPFNYYFILKLYRLIPPL